MSFLRSVSGRAFVASGDENEIEGPPGPGGRAHRLCRDGRLCGSPGQLRHDDCGRQSAAPAANLDSPDIEGLYDVGGHRLYLACTGDGPVTVVYVHGWVNNAGYVPHNSATGIRDLLSDDFRVCLYDRRNVGSSDTVDAYRLPRTCSTTWRRCWRPAACSRRTS